MQDIILMIMGVFVSVILFLFTYRQTVGAKKERIRAANKDVEQILIRRIVNESSQLSLTDIVRLIKGKARDAMVKEEDLYVEEQVLNSIFTRVVESDFIKQEQREEVLSRLSPIIEEYDNNKEVNYYNEVKNSDASHKPLIAFLSLMAILASIIGSIFATLPTLKNGASTNDPYILVFTISGSLLVIGLILLLRGFQESQKKVTLSDSSLKIQSGIKFEDKVGKLILKKNYAFQPSKLNEGYDFLVNHKDGKILIEVKAWNDRVPFSVMERAVTRLKESVESEKAKEGIIVIKEPIRNQERFSKESEVKVLTTKELSKYL